MLSLQLIVAIGVAIVIGSLGSRRWGVTAPVALVATGVALTAIPASRILPASTRRRRAPVRRRDPPPNEETTVRNTTTEIIPRHAQSEVNRQRRADVATAMGARV